MIVAVRWHSALAALALATAWSAPVRAHDVTSDLHGTGETRVVFRYGDGQPMAGAEFHVFAPGDAAIPASSGLTDEAGAVAFTADRDGSWRVDASDNSGHASRARVVVTNGVPGLAGRAIPEWFVALSLFANALLGMLLLLRRRRSVPTPVARRANVASERGSLPT